MYKKIVFWSFIISIPIILYALIIVLPTFDDWTYITAPYSGDFFTSERLLPCNGYWRPFDAIIGSLTGLNHHLFPALNHCIVFMGHIGCTIIVYLLSNRKIFPAVFFFLTPGMLGAVLDIDSANQVYSAFWGLLSILLYLRGKTWWWIICVIIATFCKENGIMYCVIPPIIAYAIQTSKSFKPYLIDLCKGVAWGVVYLLLRMALSPSESKMDDVYLNSTFADHIKDFIQFLAYTWLPIDYEAIVYEPTRCLPIGIATFFAVLPFILFLSKDVWCNRKSKILFALLACFFIAALPHLITLFSIMHTYAGLGFAALIIGYFFSTNGKWRKIAIGLFVVTAIITDVHHWHAAYESGLVGKQMSKEILSKYEKYPQNVYLINTDRGEAKYSTFNVIPREAFGWGLAARYYSGYKCAAVLEDTTIVVPYNTELEEKEISKIIKSKATPDNAIWLVDGEHVSILH